MQLKLTIFLTLILGIIVGAFVGMFSGIYFGQASLYTESYSNIAKMTMVRNAIEQGNTDKAIEIANNSIESHMNLISFITKSPFVLSPRQKEELETLVMASEKRN